MKTNHLLMIALASGASAARANAPYVTLYYSDPKGSVLMRDIVVTEETEGSYYCAMGWFGNDGYAGLQRTTGNRGTDGKTFYKHLHFSLWDTPTKQPIPMIWKRPEVIVDGFGGEGEGVKSLWPFDWKVGSRYTIALKVWDTGPTGTAWGMWFRDNDHETWYRTATWGLPIPGARIDAGTYSFIEDYLGNNKSRGMRVGPSWKLDMQGKWFPLQRTTVRERDGLRPWDVSISDGAFAMLSGGATEPHLANGTALSASFPDAPTLLPQAPRLTATYRAGSVIATWTADSSKSPPFSHELEIVRDGNPVKKVSRVDPSALADTVAGLALTDGRYTLKLSQTDIFEKVAIAEAEFTVGISAIRRAAGNAGEGVGAGLGAGNRNAMFGKAGHRRDARGRAQPAPVR